MTLPGFQPLTPLVDVTYQGLLIQGTEQSVEIAQAIEKAYVAGTINGGGSKMGDYPDGSPGWLVQLTINGELYTGYQYDWLILGSDNTLRICAGTSRWPGINPRCAHLYTTDTPVIWAATETAPTATAQPGGTAEISFPEPTSANSPFIYAVTMTDTTATTSSGATLSGDPIVVGGEVTLTVEGLTADDELTFEVTVSTQYDGVTATSLPTAPITAVA